MKTLITICLVVITATACQGMLVTLDENGNGNIDGSQSLQYGVDDQGGDWATLYYILPGPVSEGDVVGMEPPEYSIISDVLRFRNVGEQARVYVYSDIGDNDKADTGIPTLSGTPVYVNEVGPEGNNYLDYTADTITYHFISDVPEPATICLLGLGALGLLRRKR